MKCRESQFINLNDMKPTVLKYLLLLAAFSATALGASLFAQNWETPAYYYDLDARLGERIEQAHLGCANNCAGISSTDGHDGVERGALNFNGGFLGVDNFDYDFRATTSLSVWLYVPSNAPAAAAYILDARTPGESNLPVLLLDNRSNQIRWGVTPGLNEYDNAYARDEWFHLVVVTNLIIPGSYDCYVNGVLLTPTTPASTYNFATQQGSTQLRVGSSGSQGVNTLFRGRMDELRIYTSSLSQSDVTALYNARPDYLNAHYPFDNSSYTDVVVGYDLTPADANSLSVTAGYDGTANEALAFNNTYLKQDPPSISGTTSMTTAMWLKKSAQHQQNRVVFFDGRAPGTSGFPVAIYDDIAQHIVYLHGNGRTEVDFTMPVDQWVHYAFITNESTGELDIYINGVLQLKTGGSTTMTTPNNTSMQTFTIGDAGARANGLTGAIDELYIYSKVLSAAEIADLADVMVDTEAPTPVGNLGFTVTGARSARIAWSASTDNVGVTEYIILNNNDVEYTRTQNLFWENTNITPGFPYTHKVIAVDAAGNRSAERRTTVFISAADTEAPTIPGNFALTSVNPTEAAVTWTASTDNVGVSLYQVALVPQGQQPTSSDWFNRPDTRRSEVFLSLVPATDYTAFVRARDAAGNVSMAAQLDFTTAAALDTEAPTTPSNVNVTGLTTTEVTVNWAASTDNVAVSEYQVSVVLQGEQTRFWATFSAATLSADFSALTAGTTYTAYVRARDAAQNISAAAQLDFTTLASPDTEAPTQPSPVQVSNVSATAADVGWATSTDNIGVTGYVYTVTPDGGAPLQSQRTTQTQATLSGLMPETLYSIEVVAEDGAGNQSTPAPFSFRTLAAPDTQAPTAPANAVTFDLLPTSFGVSWDASTDNVGVEGYIVKEATLGVLDTVTFDPNAQRQSYSFTGANPQTNYLVELIAYDAAGNESNEVRLAVVTPASSSSRSLQVAGYAVYPNPIGDGLLTLQGPSEISSVVIHDLMGREVLRTNVQNNQLSLGHLPAGSYILSAFAKTHELIGRTQLLRQ